MYANNRILMYDDANYGVYYYSIALLLKNLRQNISIMNTLQIHEKQTSFIQSQISNNSTQIPNCSRKRGNILCCCQQTVHD